MELSFSDVHNILKIIDEAPHLHEIDLVYGSFRLHVVRNGAAGSRPGTVTAAREATMDKGAPADIGPPRPASSTGAGAAMVVPEDVVAIRAPMLGTFYRAPAPGEKPFVEVGQRVRADDTVCLLEVMKLFNSIRAGVDGEVVKIIAENGGLVEFDEPLIFIAPGRQACS
jgi:acetyl-CoA carboxylase biotin carboxyl carrier protein